MNLLINAFKYTHAKGRVTVKTRAENGRNVAGKGCVFTIELPEASVPSA